jgi:hypothetical protein
MNFNVLGDPPSIFLNFEVIAEKASELLSFADFPTWLKMTPIAILEGEDPKMYLTLNAYGVTGIYGRLSGLRAEWSIYVAKSGGRPSYLVVSARHSADSLDSVNGFTQGTEVRHANASDGISTFFVQEHLDGTTFRSMIPSMSLQNATRAFPSREWIAANDRIYWRNGVCDRTFYDGEAFNRQVLVVDPNTVTIADGTYFAPFVKPTPISVVVYENKFDFAISPWYNLDYPC